MNKNAIIKYVLFAILLVTVSSVSFALQVEILDTNPSPATAGEYVDITLRLTNPNNADEITKDVYFGIKETNTISVIDENPKLIGSIEKGRSISRTFRVFISENVPQGDITIQSFANISGNVISFESNVFVQEDESQPDLLIGDIKTTPKELLSDTNDNEMIITLLNLGDKDADLVSAVIKTDDALIKPSYSYSLKDSVASINAGEEKELTFTIDIEEDAKNTIPATLDLTYRVKKSTSSSYKTINEQIPFTIDLIESPHLKITSVEQLDDFTTGSTENTIRLTITNTGQAEAQEVRVRLIPDISYPFSFEQLTQYVSAKIKPNQSAQIEFSAEVFEDGITKDYSITARLESLVGENRYSQDDVFAISVTKEEQSSTRQIAVIVVVLIIIAAIIFSIFGRDKT